MAVAKKLTTTYRPYPLVGVITPWNFPFAMPGLDVVPALAAGAAVLLKPSEVTPLSAVEFVRGWTEVGAPPVLAVATGYGETGAAVIDAVDYLQFTGSTATGRKVAVRCAQRLIPYSLELGGKDPAIVLADADLERAANGIAWGGLFNSGQVCRVGGACLCRGAGVRRVRRQAHPQSGRSCGKAKTTRSCKHDVGAMATAAQRDIVQRHVDDAVAAGATVVDRRQTDRNGHVLRTDGARRRRALDDLHDRGDVRPDAAGHEGGR